MASSKQITLFIGPMRHDKTPILEVDCNTCGKPMFMAQITTSKGKMWVPLDHDEGDSYVFHNHI